MFSVRQRAVMTIAHIDGSKIHVVFLVCNRKLYISITIPIHIINM